MDQLDARGVAEQDLAVRGEDLAVLRIHVEHAPVEVERAAPPARRELGRGEVRGDPRVLRLLAGQRVEAAARLRGRAPGQVEPGLQPAQPRRRGIVGQVAIHHGDRLVELARVHEQLRVVLAERAVVAVALEQRAIGRERLLGHAQARQDARPHHLGLERVGRRRASRGPRAASGRARCGAGRRGRGTGGRRRPTPSGRRSPSEYGGGVRRVQARPWASARASGQEPQGALELERARALRPGRPRRARPGGSAPRSRRPSRG